MTIDKTIYKIDSKNKSRFLRIQSVADTVIQESGVVGSENIVKHVSSCSPKNVGKINETTAVEQAYLEASAKIKKKLSEGYYETLKEASSSDLILPMLAKDFKEEFNKVTYPFFVQPKLDGMRSLKYASKGFVSRKNKPINTVKHIEQDFKDIDFVLDGELYAHGETFQRNMELIKKYRKDETENIKYHVYDMIDTNAPFSERYRLLCEIFEKFQPVNTEIVPTFMVNTYEELIERHTEFLKQGYEGTIVRWGNKGYEINKRSSNLLKFKDFKDVACNIVDVKPSEKRPEQGSFVCELEDGRTFGCGMRFSQDERVNILKNKELYIGKVAEIRFFEFTDEGIPRFPVCVGLRLDK